MRLVVVFTLLASPVAAGGMELPVHGVHSLARAGALVAGAGDADALWLDPAGLAHLAGNGKQALLFDAAFVYQTVDYEPPGEAHVTNQQPGQAIPQLAGALGIGDRLVIAGGLSSPYAGLHRYAADTPQRYASVSLDGSHFVAVTVGAAYKLDDRLRVGATLQDVVSQVSQQVVVSACPGTMTCAPGDRTFDALVAVKQTDAISPSGSIGIQYDVAPEVTVGLVGQAPARVSATGKLAVTLPSSPVFTNATVTGDRARLAFTLPPSVRAGVEWRPAHWRIEAALGAELWSLHHDVTITPDAITIDGATGGPYAMHAMTIARDYRTAWAPAIAVEWHGPKLMLGAGYSYETAAAPAGTVSVLTVDAPKHVVGLGGGYEDAGWQIGAAVGLAALATVDVTDPQVTELAPLADAPTTTAVNAGSYKSRYLVAGLRFARRW